MFGSRNVLQSTCGSKTRGAAPSSWTRIRISPSAVMRIARPERAHFVRISTETGLFHSRPCTKGAAIASSAQAAYSPSPLSKVRRCGVRSTVTG